MASETAKPKQNYKIPIKEMSNMYQKIDKLISCYSISSRTPQLRKIPSLRIG